MESSSNTEHQREWWPFEQLSIARKRLIVEQYDGSDGYQRDLNQRFVDEAVHEFDAIRFDAIKTARIIDGRWGPPRHEGLFAVIDGQHRLAIAEALQLASVPCDVYAYDMDYCKRALEFFKLNRVKRLVRTAEGLRALYEAEDEETLQMLACLERNRFYIPGLRPEDANGHRPLHAIYTIQKAYATNANALDQALRLLRPWNQLLGRRHEKTVIGALMLWCRRDDVDLDRLESILQAHGPDYLMRDAGELAAVAGKQNPNARMFAKVLLRHYNTNLRSNRVEDAF